MIQQAKEILKKTFGYDHFRPHQEEIISQVLLKKDTLVLMPTGGGKSLCYQIPAMIFPEMTIVVSPLISLMKDQVNALTANGISAAFLNSSLTAKEEERLIEQVMAGDIKMLYVSPERLFTIAGTWLSMCEIGLFAIDEAHCVSMWGHDFRTEYTQIKHLRKKFDHVPFMALTATADKVTRKDIVEQIGLKNPEVYISSFDRPNLSLEVRANVTKRKKIKEIISFIQDRPNDSGIIYALSRKNVEELGNELRDNGIEAGIYHAGLSTAERTQVQEDFVNDNLKIICATIAFGMGIDKSNIRWIIHNNLPKNIESFYQEIGRAGRDGLDSDTLMYYNYGDLVILKQFISKNEYQEVNEEKLQRIFQYAEATSCRRRVLLSYFGEHLKEDCGNCDVCLNPPAFIDGTKMAQMALSAIVRTNENIASNMLINILRGAKNADLMQANYHSIKTYGVGSQYSFQEWQHFLTQMLNQGLFEVAYDKHFTLKITPLGKEVLFNGQSVKMTSLVLSAEKKKKEKKKATPDEQLFNDLKALRKKIATEKNVPAYVIFHDATLTEMAETKPQNIPDLLTIQGISEVKANAYGEPFLELIEKHQFHQKRPFEQTFEMYQHGLSPEEIAEQKGVTLQTVISHLSKSYLDGKPVDLERFITDQELQRIREAIPKVEDSTKLKSFFDYTNGEIPYDKIRIALTIIEKKG